jgi:hypothetical protein
VPYAIIRGANGRRHEVDFGDAPFRVEIHTSEEAVEIFVEVFALLNIPRHLFSEASAAARRASKRRPAPSM